MSHTSHVNKSWITPFWRMKSSHQNNFGQKNSVCIIRIIVYVTPTPKTSSVCDLQLFADSINIKHIHAREYNRQDPLEGTAPSYGAQDPYHLSAHPNLRYKDL